MDRLNHEGYAPSSSTTASTTLVGGQRGGRPQGRSLEANKTRKDGWMTTMNTMLKPLIQQTHSWNLRIIQFLKEHFEIGQVFRGFIVSCRWNSQLFWWFFGRFSYSELRHGMRHDQVISWICFLSVFWYNSYVFLCFWLYIIILPFDMSAFLPRDSYLLNHDLRNISLFGHSFELGDFEGTPTCWLSMRICSIVFFQVNTFWFDWVQIFWFFWAFWTWVLRNSNCWEDPGNRKSKQQKLAEVYTLH